MLNNETINFTNSHHFSTFQLNTDDQIHENLGKLLQTVVQNCTKCSYILLRERVKCDCFLVVFLFACLFVLFCFSQSSPELAADRNFLDMVQ